MIKSIITLICIFLMSTATYAEDKKPTLLADVWSITPNSGQESEFYVALKEHIKFRTEKKDPREWNIYNQVVGDDLDTYVIRACCFEWAAQDAYIEWGKSAGTGEHFNKTVGPYVAHASHNFSILDQKNSNWSDDTVANYVGVSHYQLKNGSNDKFYDAVKSITKILKDNNWPRSWAFSYPVVGQSNRMTIATPFKNYADMAPLEVSISKFLSDHLKSEKKAKKMLDEFSAGIESSSYTIYKENTALK
jgi:hypothetical protein